MESGGQRGCVAGNSGSAVDGMGSSVGAEGVSAVIAAEMAANGSAHTHSASRSSSSSPASAAHNSHTMSKQMGSI